MNFQSICLEPSEIIDLNVKLTESVGIGGDFEPS